jgi:hypothetical protein
MRDAFFCRFPTWAVASKEARYHRRLSDAGLCVRCRRVRDRAGWYCDDCREYQRLRSRRGRAA